jgi:hypothetical protein
MSAHPGKEKERRRTPGSEKGGKEKSTSVDREEVEEEQQGEGRGTRRSKSARALYARWSGWCSRPWSVHRELAAFIPFLGGGQARR